METLHKIYINDARNMNCIEDNSIDLIVTSPPYPMIEMWDELFKNIDEGISNAFEEGNGFLAFELMHRQLDVVWSECFRVLKEGSYLCINIGDATRTINNNFILYPNHARIINACINIGFYPLPDILWRKQTNAPNKFMGSGMLPKGAYVTLEHEYILIFRKGTKKNYKSDAERKNRQESAYFWEERNVWFSDVWDFKGTSQKIGDSKSRDRSAAYPFELPYRIINMYSAKNDVVLDPFAGTGTTMIAAMACGRNSISIEIDVNFKSIIESKVMEYENFIKEIYKKRLRNHIEFTKTMKNIKYKNLNYDFPVVTNQEVNLKFSELKFIEKISENVYRAEY
ncbi:DNA modification methylase [Caloramator quimbayensis]|uniref:Methyltransferase n=1 Tax=Caloramator quimbayensis TaxID=1147123 RepID=A0A1T4Y4Y3_9CLOT|nr:site-specific DNA-methyltransferase [Caloramator quimbayensis]SKA96884.1 DNA modification methylase [Caloramator quimbayensis]